MAPRKCPSINNHARAGRIWLKCLHNLESVRLCSSRCLLVRMASSFYVLRIFVFYDDGGCTFSYFQAIRRDSEDESYPSARSSAAFGADLCICWACCYRSKQGIDQADYESLGGTSVEHNRVMQCKCTGETQQAAFGECPC